MEPLKDPESPRASFKAIGDNAGTDKTIYHGYHRFYPPHLERLRQIENLGILEIGYGKGESLTLWLEYFPNAFVYCIDRDVESQGERHRVIKADQADPDSVDRACKLIQHPIHLIIDDGSHLPSHQTSSFSILFPSLLQANGIYIVEDVETSYWLAGELYGNQTRYGLFCPWSAIEAFKLIADYTNRQCLAACDLSLLEYRMALTGITTEAASSVASVAFSQNCIIMSKALTSDAIYWQSPYFYAPFTHRDP